MPKTNKDKYRIDVYCARDNGLALLKFCRENGISVNSMVNHLIVSFLLNKHKYAFNFVDNDGDEQQVDNQHRSIKNESYEDEIDDDDCFPEIIKKLLEDKEDSVDYSF